MNLFHLAEISIDATQAAIGGLGLVATLIGYHFVISRYIRQQAGISETHLTQVEGVRASQVHGEPLTVRAEVEFVPVPKFKEFEDYVHQREHKILGDINALSLVIEDRREEAAEQITDLRQQLDRKFSEAITANASSASKTHARIDALASTTGQLIGEMKHVAQGARDAAKAAQAAAIAAAQAGGKK